MSLKPSLILPTLLAILTVPSFAQADRVERIFECTQEFNSSEWKITLSTDLTRAVFSDGRFDIKLKLKNLRGNDYTFESFNRGPLIRFYFQSKQKTGWFVDYVGSAAERSYPFRCKKIDAEVGAWK